MPHALLSSYGEYGEFNSEKFFITKNKCLPSKLALSLPLESKQENMKKALDLIDMKKFGLSIIAKEWKISSTKNKDASEDFPNEFLIDSENSALLLFVKLYNESLLIEFLYSIKNKELEPWVLKTYQKLRENFGKPNAPELHLLSRSGPGFYTEELAVNTSKLEINKLYNDDFQKVHQSINDSLSIDKSGLILFHGPPGTGKTSYIKYLLSNNPDKKFIFIPNDFVRELLQPEFVSFLLTRKNAILVIEDAEKVIASREHKGGASVVSTILQLTDGLFSDYLHIKVICTFNTSIDKIDKALLRKGRMIAYYEFNALEKEKANELMITLGNTPVDKDMTLAEIFNFDQKDFTEGIEKKKIGFA